MPVLTLSVYKGHEMIVDLQYSTSMGIGLKFMQCARGGIYALDLYFLNVMYMHAGERWLLFHVYYYMYMYMYNVCNS